MADLYVCSEHGETNPCGGCRAETTKPQSTTEPPDRIWIERAKGEGYPRSTGFYAESFADGIEYARVTRFYFCSCGGALTAEEYLTHYFELGHDRGDPASPASTAPVVDNPISTRDLHSVICGVVHHHCKDVQLPFGTNGLENDLIEKLSTRTSPASATPVADGISWSALLPVLERLRSKNRNPDNEWYHGWNAAIQCLINDINARSTAAAAAPQVNACGPARLDDGSECAFGFCPRPRDGCSEYCVEHHGSQCNVITAAPVDHAAIPLLGYERVITIEWDKHNARRHELIEAGRTRLLSEDEIVELHELQWLAGIKRELLSGPNAAAPSTKTIEAFRDLKPGWDSYGGRTINTEAIEIALQLAPLLPDWQPVPRSDGGIQFERGDDEICIDIANSKE